MCNVMGSTADITNSSFIRWLRQLWRRDMIIKADLTDSQQLSSVVIVQLRGGGAIVK